MSAPDPGARAAAVRLMAFDVDGTLTDGGIHIGPNGESHKRFSVRDGFGRRGSGRGPAPRGTPTRA